MKTAKLHFFITILAAFLLLFSASCSKKTEKAPEPQATVEILQGNVNAVETPAPDLEPKNGETAAADVREDNPSNDLKDAPDDSEIDTDDSDTEIKYSEECGPNKFEDWDLSLLRFGKKNELQGDFSQAKWSDLEPKLPLPILKVASGQDVIKQLESTVKLDCSLEILKDDNTKPMFLKAADGTTVQLIFCSEHVLPRAYWDGFGDVDKLFLPKGHFCSPVYDEENNRFKDMKNYKLDSPYLCNECSNEYANAAYLSLTSPKDHFTRVYQIAALNSDAADEYPYGHYISGILDFGLVMGECSSYSQSNSLSVTDVESKPFMDTTGIYIRTEWRCDHDTEHAGGGDDDLGLIYTTWLFAGDKLRLVTHWEDAYYNRNSYYSDGSCDDCVKYCGDISYYETYMYYQSGTFETKKSIVAKTKDQFNKVISKRP